MLRSKKPPPHPETAVRRSPRSNTPRIRAISITSAVSGKQHLSSGDTLSGRNSEKIASPQDYSVSVSLTYQIL